MTSASKLSRTATEPSDRRSPIREIYCQRTPRCAASFAAAESVMPGGTSRQAGHWLPYPITIERGVGAYVWDLDGNRYIDLLNNFSSMAHGHAYPPIVDAVRRQVGDGTGWGVGCVAQTGLARQLIERLPSVEQVRFTNSGAEAANLALMIARAVTGRRRILMARFGYHGALVEFEAGSFNVGGPDTLMAEYGDLDDFKVRLDELGSDVAAVFVEPAWGAGGMIPGSKDFLTGVVTAAREAGCLSVFDEVQTFRLSLGGRQRQLDIEPDLTMLGKVIGGGFPVGAVGGAREFMRVLDPGSLKAYHSGTFNANPVTMSAGEVAVRELTDGRIAAMDALAQRLETGLVEGAGAAGLPLATNRLGSFLCMFFLPRLPSSPLDRADLDVAERFHLAALNHGVLMAGRGYMALSTVTTEAQIDESIERLGMAMCDVATEIEETP